MPASAVVSRNFTDTESWMFGGDRLCQGCGWAYATPAARREVYLIAQHPTSRRQVLTRIELGQRLVSAPLTSGEVAVIPVRGRRHILPTADWGHVCTDDTMLRWDTDAMELLDALRWLRTLPRVRAGALTEAVPPVAVLRAAPTQLWPTIMDRWAAVGVWRSTGGCWWDAAIALSTPPAVS